MMTHMKLDVDAVLVLVERLNEDAFNDGVAAEAGVESDGKVQETILELDAAIRALAAGAALRIAEELDREAKRLGAQPQESFMRRFTEGVAFAAEYLRTSVAEESPGPRCFDCGEPYGSPRFPDLVVPHRVWNELLSPTGDEGGLLCPNCMNARADRAGIECVAHFTSGPFAEPSWKGSSDSWTKPNETDAHDRGSYTGTPLSRVQPVPPISQTTTPMDETGK